MFARRLADLAFQCSIDRDGSELIELLEAKGCEVEESESGVIRIRRKGFTTALNLGDDPITCMTVINFALFKMYWYWVPDCKEAFEIVKKEYSQLVKEKNKQKKSEQKKVKAKRTSLSIKVKPKQQELF